MINFADPTMPLMERVERLNDLANQALDENEALKAQLAKVQAKLDGLIAAFEEGGSLGMLQVIGADKSLPIEIRIRALGLAVPYERPKLSAVMTAQAPVKLFDILERSRNAGKVIEQAPGPVDQG
jgi:hypothetical protein